GFWITDPENGRLNVLSDVNRAIWAAFKQHGIQVAHPKRDIRIMDERSFRQSTRQEIPDIPEAQNSRTMPDN
ncbi:hypothetical protein ABTF26_20995, partial [Acinetobacter baumannii]